MGQFDISIDPARAAQGGIWGNGAGGYAAGSGGAAGSPGAGGFNWGGMLGGFSQAAPGLMQGMVGSSGAPYGVAIGPYRSGMQGAIGGFNPYTQAGSGAISQYQDRINQMQDPVAYNNSIMNQYQQSPFAKFQIEQGIKSANNAASASGMQGSGAEQKALADYSQGVSSRDQQQFFQNAQGTNQNYQQMLQQLMANGLTAQQAQAQLQQMLAEAEGKAAYGQAQGKSNDNNAAWGGALSGAASGAMSGSMFGPWGAAIGAGVGGLSGYLSNSGK